jgi:hypothetical protein
MKLKTCLPTINTSKFEWMLDIYSQPPLDPIFVELIHKAVNELNLAGKLTTITVRGFNDPVKGHAQIYRERPNLWPSTEVILEMYLDQAHYLNENLIYHEFGHEADRHDLPGYDPKLDERWPYTSASFWALNVAMNISVDTRLHGRGLSKEENLVEFRNHLRTNHESDILFVRSWAHPPQTWQAIEELANELLQLKDDASPQATGTPA